MKRAHFYQSLRFKIISGLVIVIALSMGGFFYLQTTYSRLQLVRNLEESSSRYLSNIIRGSLKHAMQTRDLDETRNIMKAVHEQQEVLNIFLVNKRGEVVIYSDSGNLPERFALSEPTCEICHRSESKDRPHTVLFTNTEGQDIVRNVSPIINEPECHGCHDPARKVTGMLVTDFSLRGIEERLGSEFRQRAASLAFFLLVIIGVLSLSVDRLVLVRLQRFVAAARRFGHGDFSQDIAVESRDEIGELSTAFNQMASDLRKYISERSRMEQELLRAEKRASLGVLSGGAAHEINNPLNLIAISLQKLKRSDALGSDHRGACRTMLNHVERIREIVDGLTTFAHQMKAERQLVAVQEELDRALERVEEEAGRRGIEVVRDFLPASPMVLGNPALLAQVFDKVLDNALGAMPEGGRVVVQMEEVSQNGEPLVNIRITDTGVGIPEEHLDKVFDPFFTTRGVDEGKGLGLSIALGIVEDHGGIISVESAVGRGAAVIISLPIAEGDLTIGLRAVARQPDA